MGSLIWQDKQKQSPTSPHESEAQEWALGVGGPAGVVGPKSALDYSAGQVGNREGQALSDLEISSSSSQTKFHSLEFYCFLCKFDTINLILKSS